jgi:hypothetical protein
LVSILWRNLERSTELPVFGLIEQGERRTLSPVAQ